MQGDFSGKHMYMHTITLTKQASGVILSGLICFFLIPRNHLFSYRTNIPPSWTCNMYRMWSELWPVLCAMPAFLIGLWGFDCWALDQRGAVKNTMSLPSFTWNILKRANLIQLGITTYQCRSIPFNPWSKCGVLPLAEVLQGLWRSQEISKHWSMASCVWRIASLHGKQKRLLHSLQPILHQGQCSL